MISISDLGQAIRTAYQDVGIFAHTPIGVGFDNALDCTSWVEFLSCSHDCIVESVESCNVQMRNDNVNVYNIVGSSQYRSDQFLT